MADRSEIERKSVKSRIYSPESFDRKAFWDKSFASQIAGCSTFSLNHVLKNMSAREISIATYPSLYAVKCDLDGDVYKEVFGTQEERGLDYIKTNRRSGFGEVWSAKELALDYGVPENIVHGDSALMHEFYGIVHRIKDLKGEKEIGAEVTRYVENLPSKSLKGMFLQAFGDYGTITRFVIDLKGREGVQVIYGGKQDSAFAAFIKSQKHVRADDRGVEIYSNIPNRFVQAVIPLGKYEQEKIKRYI